ncbi:MAG TPA: deoxyribose-phosphate aldolase [Clostridia bacterium]|nr:deoxyribose-phosphate aldolase [Clostridia bacterium]
MQLSCFEIPKLIDISAVRANVTYEEVEALAFTAKKYGFVCAFTMPCFTSNLVTLLKNSSVSVGGAAGFPSGADCTEEKVSCAIREKQMGCEEIDMVINIGSLLSGDDDRVRSDIRAVVEAVSPLPVKAILEVAYLTNPQIVRACEIAVEAGVTFVKSGTGWASAPTTLEHIRIMKQTVGDRAKIKAAGGVRTLSCLEEMVDAGCCRFGISVTSALSILKEAYARDGIPFDETSGTSTNPEEY